jgi:hypothetical protein
MPLVQCPICPGNAEMHRGIPEIGYSCSRCGNYRADQAIGWLHVEALDHQVKLSGWIREQNNLGAIPLISPDISRRVAAMRLPGMRDRANRALIEITGRMRFGVAMPIGQVIGDTKTQATSYSFDSDDLLILIHLLLDEDFLRRLESSTTHQLAAVALTTKGLMFVEGLRSAVPDSGQGFVAMSFSDELRDAWLNGFDPAIRAAGYRPMRIDAKDYAGGVMDEIIAEIRRSRFVIADCTQQRNGVYFEAGFAIGLGLTVIPTCQADDMKNRHFDIQHLNTLEWQTPADLVEALAKRIVAVLGPGPDLPPR